MIELWNLCQQATCVSRVRAVICGRPSGSGFDGLGLEVLFRADASAEGGHALLMVGWPDAAWHLELVSDPGGETPAAPTEEDLLVLFCNGEVDAGVVRRLAAAGGTQVAARNPYWDQGGVTILDPDGYRLVLTSRSWP